MSKILIIKLGALGDVVLATPLIDAILAHHRHDACTLVTTPAFAPLFAPWPALAVEAFPRRGAWAMWRLLRFVRAGGFDRVYDLQGNDRTAALCALSGIPERVGNHPRYPYTHHPDEPWTGQSHIFERMRAVLASAGVTVTHEVPLLPASNAVRSRVGHWLRESGPGARPFAAIHAGASAARPAKRWPHFGTLTTRLRGVGIDVVWLGGEADRTVNRALAAYGGHDATDVFDVLALAEVGRRARFAVTNDSGPMHVLAAAGIPVFGLFGPSDWRRNHALGQAERVIACVDISPAHAGERCGDCLDSVTVDHVWARLAAENLVGGTPPSR